MNFDFSDDQKFLKGEARKFLDDKAAAKVNRAVLDDASATHDAALWRDIAAMGWLGAAIPEAYGGLGLGHVELCAIAEEMGRVVAPVPFASTVYFFAEALMLAGTEDQKMRLLPKVAAGELIGTVATSEAPGAPSPETLSTTVEDGRMNGVKIPVTDGEIADVAVVLAREAAGASLYLVELTGEGVRRETLKSLDPSRNLARVTFEGAKAERLGGAGDGFALIEAIFDRAAVLIAFEQVGGADKALEMAKNFALGRYAFGRTIASYQAIKHKLADIYVKNELARSNAYYGAWALGTAAPELPIAASAARIAASDAFWFAAKENVQTHGGMGFTWEVDAHLYYRRALQLGLVCGSVKSWKERLISQLERKNAA